jgi:hypothetical protein
MLAPPVVPASAARVLGYLERGKSLSDRNPVVPLYVKLAELVLMGEFEEIVEFLNFPPFEASYSLRRQSESIS